MFLSRTLCRGPNKNKFFQKLSEALSNDLSVTIVLIQSETISYWSNFKLLSIINKKKKTKFFFAGDFIDNRRLLQLCVQILSLLKNLWENANCLFLMKAQITR